LRLFLIRSLPLAVLTQPGVNAWAREELFLGKQVSNKYTDWSD